MVESSKSVDEYLPYLLCWKQNDNYATLREDQEYNVRTKRNWKHISKTDSKTMWINYVAKIS